MNEDPLAYSDATTATAGVHPGVSYETESSLHRKAGQAANSMQSEAERLKNSALEQGAAVMEQMKTGVRTATQQAQEAGTTFVRTQQENLAQRLSEYAGAARAASQRLSTDEGNMLAGPAEQAATQLERLSGYLRDSEPADLMEDLENFARRRPEVVFGGLFVVGLAAARFLKASRRRLDEREMPRRTASSTGLGAPRRVDYPPTSDSPYSTGVASTPSSSTPSSHYSAPQVPSASSTSAGPLAPAPDSQGLSTSTSDCGCSPFPESSTQSNPMP